MIEDIDLKKEVLLGVFIGALFIFLNIAFGLVIGIPLLAFSSQTEKYVVQDALAPLVEEGVFRALLPFILTLIGISIIINAVINIILFAAVHYAVYGSSFSSASALFIGAGLFALVAFLATYYQSDPEDFQVPLASIIGHGIINTWLGIKISGLVIVGGL